MYLHDDPSGFQKLISDAAAFFGRPELYVSKDYYAVMMLKAVTQAHPAFVFKGGTSLSKCYGAIDRFSEDIDLGVSAAHVTEGERKAMKRAVVKAADSLGLEISNIHETRSRREYNRYQVTLPCSLGSASDVLIVETAVMTPASPCVRRPLQSLVGEYCDASGFGDVVAEYGLEQFQVMANSLERTFCDKVYALCDYYLAREPLTRQSRHIYDLYKLAGILRFDEPLANLMETVRREREGGYRCPSADAGVDLASILDEIVESNAYQSDYERMTMPLLYEPVAYGQSIDVLQKVARFLRAGSAQ